MTRCTCIECSRRAQRCPGSEMPFAPPSHDDNDREIMRKEPLLDVAIKERFEDHLLPAITSIPPNHVDSVPTDAPEAISNLARSA